MTGAGIARAYLAHTTALDGTSLTSAQRCVHVLCAAGGAVVMAAAAVAALGWSAACIIACAAPKALEYPSVHAANCVAGARTSFLSAGHGSGANTAILA
jgi:hypothetical protein